MWVFLVFKNLDIFGIQFLIKIFLLLFNTYPNELNFDHLYI
jgi:hypothetical protein